MLYGVFYSTLLLSGLIMRHSGSGAMNSRELAVRLDKDQAQLAFWTSGSELERRLRTNNGPYDVVASSIQNQASIYVVENHIEIESV